jgi:hypothetical protein
MGEIFSAAGQVAAASIQASAVQAATQMQIDALERQRQYVYNNLDPSVIGPQATQADLTNALTRLAIQGQIDPALLGARYGAENNIAQQLGQIGIQSNKVANQATTEALAGTPGMEAAKNQLVAEAQKELSAGATLPPDVQAELVKAGLEQSGMTTGSASGRGTGGQILRTILGSAGIQLQKQRQEQASGLLTAAQNLDSSRQNILQSLFPNLSKVQLANLGGSQSVLSQSNSMLPSGGLSGTDVANIWLARVGATNQLSQSAANAAAQGAMAQGNIWGNLTGGLTRNLGDNSGSAWNTVSGWFGGGGGGGGSSNISEDQNYLD